MVRAPIFEPTSCEFTVKVVTKPEEIRNLLEVGLEYARQTEGLVFLRKGK